MHPSNSFHIISKLFLFTLFFHFSSFCFSQQEAITKTEAKKSNVKWTKYHKSSAAVIEYAFENDHPKKGFKSEFLLFRITNKTNSPLSVAWDFSATRQSGKCINCDHSSPEFHFEKKIPENSTLVGNINAYNKTPLVIFHQFIDERFKGRNDLFTTNFKLNNLLIK